MKNYELDRIDVNIEKLDADLRATLGTVYLGLTVRDNSILLHADDAITGAQVSIGRQIIQDHDATQLSDNQQQKASIQADIATLKQSIGNIDALTNTEATEAIKLLYKILQLNDLI